MILKNGFQYIIMILEKWNYESDFGKWISY